LEAGTSGVIDYRNHFIKEKKSAGVTFTGSCLPEGLSGISIPGTTPKHALPLRPRLFGLYRAKTDISGHSWHQREMESPD